jgi:phage N-6-adenine-methyltransferase
MTTEAIRTGPSINKGRSKQDYGTPPEFIDAVVKRFGPLYADLAATNENKKALIYLGPDHPSPDLRDSLALDIDWAELFPNKNLWLNPPFANIDPWAEKLAKQCRYRLGLSFFLTPASIGSNWFANHVAGKAFVLGLSPRLTFDGTDDPYPKDLSLSVFGFGLHGFDTWRWK